MGIHGEVLLYGENIWENFKLDRSLKRGKWGRSNAFPYTRSKYMMCISEAYRAPSLS